MNLITFCYVLNLTLNQLYYSHLLYLLQCLEIHIIGTTNIFTLFLYYIHFQLY